MTVISPGSREFRAAYDRAFQTPAIENLLLASSGKTGAAGEDTVQLPVLASRGDFLEGGSGNAAVPRTVMLEAVTTGA